MFPRNENRNEGTFGCSPGTKTGTKTGTRVRSHVLPERKPEGGHIRQNPPFTKLPFYLPVKNELKKLATTVFRMHCGNNSNKIFLRICICYEIRSISQIIFYSLCGPLKAAKNSCVCICYENLIPKSISSVSVSAMRCIINLKICFSVCNAIWTTSSQSPLKRAGKLVPRENCQNLCLTLFDDL